MNRELLDFPENRQVMAPALKNRPYLK